MVTIVSLSRSLSLYLFHSANIYPIIMALFSLSRSLALSHPSVMNAEGNCDSQHQQELFIIDEVESAAGVLSTAVVRQQCDGEWRVESGEQRAESSGEREKRTLLTSCCFHVNNICGFKRNHK